MNWAGAIKRNREILQAILAALFAMLRVEGGTQAARLPRSLHSAILRILRPAESAVRRLIVVAARDLTAKPHVPRPMSAKRIVRNAGSSRLAFRLFDPPKRFVFPRIKIRPRAVPRIRLIDFDPPVRVFSTVPRPAATPAPPSDGFVDSRSILRRLEAVKLALGDLPRQAKRLARLRAKQAAMPDQATVKSPLRPGKPPGHRDRPTHEIDRVLAECDTLAYAAWRQDPRSRDPGAGRYAANGWG